jgi:hypothetical protein
VSGDVGLSELVAARAGAAAFEQVAGEEADVSSEGVLSDGEFRGGDVGAVWLEAFLSGKRLGGNEHASSEDEKSITHDGSG